MIDPLSLEDCRGLRIGSSQPNQVEVQVRRPPQLGLLAVHRQC